LIQNKRIKFAPKSEEEEELRKENFPWLVFDSLVILLSWAFASFSIIRAFRILRVLRLIKKVEQLKSVVAALIGVLPKMGVVAFLLSLLFIIFGVAFTILFGDLYERGLTEYDYFSRMDQTSFTLFQLMTFDDLATVARSVMDTYSWSWTLIVTWSILTGFLFMNLIIAIICESLVNLQQQKQMEQKAAEKLDIPLRSKLSREDSRRLKMETMNMMESQKSMKSIMTNVTDEYVFQLEDMVNTILDDQREFIAKFDDVKRQCKETLDNLPPEQSVVEIRKILGI
jgi:voltage-gated sodium channel